MVATRPTASSGRNRSEAGRRGDLRRPKLQDEVGGDDAGLPASRESVMRKRESRRTSGTARRGEWVAVDAVALDGGDGRVRSGRERGSRGERAVGESERSGQRDRDGTRESSTRPGARRQAGGGRACVGHTPASSWRGGEDDRRRQVGWASELGRLQVGGTGSPSLSLFYISVFYFFAVCFDLV